MKKIFKTALCLILSTPWPPAVLADQDLDDIPDVSLDPGTLWDMGVYTINEQAYGVKQVLQEKSSGTPDLLKYTKVPVSVMPTTEDLPELSLLEEDGVSKNAVHIMDIPFTWLPPEDFPHPDPKGVFHLYIPAKNASGPFILMFPITGEPDFIFSKGICSYFAENGMRCAYMERVLPKKKNLPKTAEGLFLLPGLPPYSVETARRGLDGLEQAGILRPGEKIGVAGLSLGAIDACLLAITDERVEAASLLLGGADIPKILSEIRGAATFPFPQIRKNQMKTMGWNKEQFKSEMAKRTHIGDPLAYLQRRKSNLPGNRFQMINVKGDTAIPNEASDELLQALSQIDGTIPDHEMLRVWLPSGFKHIGGILHLPYAQERALIHFKKHLGHGK